MRKKNNKITRRKFIRNSTLGVVGLAVPGRGLKSELTSKKSPGMSRIVVVNHSGVIHSSGRLDQDIVNTMVKRGIMEFTGESSEPKAWKNYTEPEGMIGLKVCTLGLNAIRGSGWVDHFSAVTKAIVKGLESAGQPGKKMIIWDRSDKELENAGFTINRDGGGPLVYGVLGDRGDDRSDAYTERSYPVGNRSVRLARILTETCSSLINIPLIKHHRNAGVTGALKSHYGTIHNPSEFHDPGCVNPGIPEINVLPEIRKKEKLIVVDGLLGLFDGGPWWDRRFIYPLGKIIIGTDPVAVDSLILEILDKKRKDEGKGPLAPGVKFIEISQKLGLGTADKKRIDLKEITLG